MWKTGDMINLMDQIYREQLLCKNRNRDKRLSLKILIYLHNEVNYQNTDTFNILAGFYSI